MRHFFKLLFVVGVISAMMFGIFFMIHAKGDVEHGSCLATFGVRGECESGVTPFDYVTEHMSAFAVLASQKAGMDTTLALFLLLEFALAFYAYDILFKPQIVTRPTPALAHGCGLSEKRRAWFVRHEKRDPSHLWRL